MTLCELGGSLLSHVKLPKFPGPVDQIADSARMSRLSRNWGGFVAVIGFLPTSILHALASVSMLRARYRIDRTRYVIETREHYKRNAFDGTIFRRFVVECRVSAIVEIRRRRTKSTRVVEVRYRQTPLPHLSALDIEAPVVFRGIALLTGIQWPHHEIIDLSLSKLKHHSSRSCGRGRSLRSCT